MRGRNFQAAKGFTLVELLVALFITAIMFAIGYRALSQALNGRKETDEQAARMLAVQKAVRMIEQDFELLSPRPVRAVIGDGYQPAISSADNPAVPNVGSGSSSSSSSSGSSSRSGSNSSSGLNGSSTSNNNASGLGSSSLASSFSGSSLGSNSSLGASNTSSSSSSSLTVNGSLGSGSSDSLFAQGATTVTFTRGGWTNMAGIERSELQRVTYVLQNGNLMRDYTPVLDVTNAVPLTTRTLLEHVKRFSLRFLDAGRQWQTTWPENALGDAAQQSALRSRPIAVEVTLELDDLGTLVRVIEVAG